MKSEIEAKLELHLNAQVKFSARSARAILDSKLRSILSALEIEIETESSQKILDHYYDDATKTLEKADVSLRIRYLNEQPFLTLKRSDPSRKENDTLVRDEFECPYTSFALPESKKMSSLLESAFSLTLHLGLLSETLTVDNLRTCFEIRTHISRAILSLDRFLYMHQGAFSDTMFMIEVEASGDEAPFQNDPQIKALRSLLQDVLGSTPVLESKVELGLRWSKNPVTPMSVHAVMFDIIGYSLLSIPEQKKAIQQLNVDVKATLGSTVGNEEPQSIYIPTGDGMIIVFQDNPDMILPFLRRLQERSRNTNATAFRCGMHSGQVFTYTDINDNVNFAGDGINLAQRIMSFAGPYQVLASESAFEAMGRVHPEMQQWFHQAGEHEVKHNLKLRIYNVYSTERSFGNPALFGRVS